MKTKLNLWPTLSAALLLAIPFVGKCDDVPGMINYQGRLTDTLGNPVGSGYYEIKFLLWADATRSDAGELVWGRTFALHVVQDGLFNILLSDNGSKVTTPSVPTTDYLLDAFDGPRWLGLTIVQSNGVPIEATSQKEISPRQELASAPFALQAQTANEVGLNGVGTESIQPHSVTGERIAYETVAETNLANGSVSTAKLQDSAVTTDKIGNSQVTTAKIGNNQVTTAKIGDGQVTASKLDINENISLQGHDFYLSADDNTGLKYDTSFGSTSLDGAVLFGNSSGVLGTKSGGQKVALSWNSTAGVSLFGPTVDISSNMAKNASDFTTYAFTAKREGFLMFFIYGSWFEVRLFQGTKEAFFNLDGQAPLGETMTWPMHIGDKVTIKLVHNHNNDNPNKLWFLPLGVGQGASIDDVMTFSHN